MEKNYFIKKTRTRFLVLMVLFCGMLASTVFGQNVLLSNPEKFDGGLHGWGTGFATGASTTTYADATESGTLDGALKLTRANDQPNSNFGLNNSANTTVGNGIDATANKYIRIRYKNGTTATQIRVAGTDNAGVSMGTTDFTLSQTAGSTYTTQILNMSAVAKWTGNIRYVWFGVRNTTSTFTDAAPFYLDEIEFLATAPPQDTYSEFIKNPSFDDLSNTLPFTGTSTFATRALANDQAHDGSQSLKYTYTGAPSGNGLFWAFSSNEKTYAEQPAGTRIQIKMWVKTNRTVNPVKILSRVVLNGGTASNTYADATVSTTNLSGGWEELTFNTTASKSFTLAKLWFTPQHEGSSATDFSIGDIMWLDQMSATLVAPPTWTGATNNEWTEATNWSPAIVPVQNDYVTISTAGTPPTISTFVNVNSLTINSGAVLTVSEGKSLTSSSIANAGELKLKSSATGTASLKSDASVENVTQERYLASNQRGWRLLSNPLSAKTFNTLASDSGITLGTNYTGEYLTDTNTWTSTDGTASMASQQAYKVFITGLTGEAPSYTTGPSNVKLVNKGTAANTVPSTISTVATQYYLVANPYTAPVSLYSIIGASSGLSNTVSYYNSTKSSTDEKLKAGGYDVVTTLSLAVAQGDSNDVILPPMGAIFVQASSAGTINIPKSAIYTGAVSGGSYNQKTAQNKVVSPAALNLEVASNGVNYDTAQLRFKEVGTAGTNVDFGKLPNSILDFYSIDNSVNKAVSELELKEQTIPLGITSTLQSSFTLNVAENTIPVGYVAELVDNVLNTTTVLTAGTSYNFDITSTSTSQGNARFAINLKTSGSLSVQANELDAKIQLYPNPAHSQFNIMNAQGKNEGASTIEIYNLNGQVIHAQKSNPGTSTTIQTNGWAAGVYMLKATNNGTQTTKKLIIQ